MENLAVSTVFSKNSDEKIVLGQLQTELYTHKQHIAVEVKNIVSSELTALVFNSHQTLLETLNKHFMHMGKEVNLEIHEIHHKIAVIEGKISEIFEKLTNFNELLISKGEKCSAGYKENREKNVELEEKLNLVKKDLEKLYEKCERIGKDMRNAKEKIVDCGPSTENVQGLIGEYWRLVEGYKFEVLERLNMESLKTDEKIAQVQNSLNKNLDLMKRSIKCPKENIESIDKYKEIIEYLNTSLVKYYSEFSNLRIRLEKVEESNQVVLEFIKSRRN